jgi:hypothetical protein
VEVTSGATWITSPATGSRRSYSVTVDEHDLVAIGINPAELPPSKLHAKLSARADMLVVAYMQQEGALDTERAKLRLKTLVEKLRA